MKTVTHLRPDLLALLVAALSILSALASGFIQRTSGQAAPRSVIDRGSLGDAGHGRKLFVQSCAHCHGDDAHGTGEDGDGPNLYRLAIGNARIAAVIRTGIPDEMPSFAKKHRAPDIVDLTSYLRTLR